MSSLDIPFGCQVDRCRGHRRRRLVDDHSAGVKEAVALANRLGVKPETNPTSKSLKNGAKRAAARLKKESASRSTRTYINIEIAYHQAVSTREERPHPERAEQGPGANTARKWALPHGGGGGATLPDTPHRCAAESGALPPRSARADREEGAGGRDDRPCLICPSAHDVTSGMFLRRLAAELADVISQAVFHITRSVKSPLH